MSTARKVSAAQFEKQSGTMLHRARRGEVIDITVDGNTVARLAPAEPEDSAAFVEEVLRFREEEDLEELDAAEVFNVPRAVEPPRKLDLG